MNEEDKFYIKKFKSSSITVIEGSFDSTLEILYRLSVDSIVILDKDTLFIDCWNTFNPYDIMKILKYYNIRSNIEQRKILSRIHIVRAFTDYQLDTLIKGLNVAIKEWNPAILIISYLPNLFHNAKNSEKLFNCSIERLKSITKSSDIITVVTSFGNYYEDKLLTLNADRIINIEKTRDTKTKSRKTKGRKFKKKNVIRIIDDGNITEHIPVPSGQTRFSQFIK